MNHEHSLMACDGITHHAQQCFSAIAECMTEPSVMYRPVLSIDGNRWCALYGEDLQSGIAGFGDCPLDALNDFNKNFYAYLPTSPKGIAYAAKVAEKQEQPK